MASVDDIVAALGRMPAAERTGWEVLYELRTLDDASAFSKPPAWFGAAVARAVEHLSSTWFDGAAFAHVRTLERAGVVTLPHDDTYVLAIVGGLGDRWDPAPRLDAIRADPELRDVLLWRVFEVEGGGEVSLANVDKHSRPEATWTECFRTLTAEGTLPRERVLSESLRALGRDFSAYRAGFFTRLHAALEPTPGEIAAAQPQLLRLLGATLPATVAFATRHLTALDRAGQLDDEAFLAAAPPALVVPAKGTPLTVLRLVAAIAGRRPDLARAVAEAAAAGLEHSHRDVQAAALTLTADDLLAARLDLLEPTVAAQARKRLGVASPPAGPVPAPADFPRSTPATVRPENAPPPCWPARPTRGSSNSCWPPSRPATPPTSWPR